MATTYIVTKKSTVHLGDCILGSGPTKQAAFEDAFGPKPWSQWQKNQAKDAHVTEATEADLERIHQ